MKNFQIDLTHEKILFYQRMTCTVLIGLMLVFSLFGGFYRIPFDDDFTVFYDALEENDVETRANTRTVKFDFSGSAVSLFKLFTLSEMSHNDYQDVYYSMIETDSPSLTLRASGIAYLVLEAFESDITVGIYYALLIFVSIVTPILILILFIIILTKYTVPKFRRTRHDVYKGTMNMTRVLLCHVPLIILLRVLVNKTRLGLAACAIITLCALCMAVNAVAPYFKKYTRPQKKYRTMIQAVSLVGILIFIAFCICLKNSSLVSKAVSLFDDRNLSDLIMIFEGGSFDIDEILSLIGGFVFFYALFGVCKSLANNFCRIGFTTTRMKKRDHSSGDAYIASTIRPNIMILVFLLLLGSQSALIFYDSEAMYFTAAMICVALMTLVEGAVIFMRETFCIDLGNGGKDSVLEGTTYEAQIEENLSSEAKTQLDAEETKRAKKAHD